ncbi:transcriptional regulator [Streptomyces sp. NPDC058001]|uniref:transcriptional regulator n=1 Tax=Streptomyces sp. NPDC058001 TaxID=3346300 RepID=UPI0036E2442E
MTRTTGTDTAHTAKELLRSTTADLAPDPTANRFVPLVARGAASPAALLVLALEQRHVIPADRRAFEHLVTRSADEPESAAFFSALAAGESLAGDRIGALVTALGADETVAEAYEPLAGCQAYPAYVAWLALNGAPSDTVLALSANFSAWGGYCATLAGGLRAHYGLDDAACGFFDFFATPAPDLDRLATEAVRAGLASGRLTERTARAHGRLLQGYEAMFWDTLAGLRPADVHDTVSDTV